MILSCHPCISPLLRPISSWRQLWPPPPRRILALFRASHQILSPARSPAPHRESTRCVHVSHCDMCVPLHSSSSGERGQCAARENQAAAAAGAAAARARRQVCSERAWHSPLYHNQSAALGALVMARLATQTSQCFSSMAKRRSTMRIGRFQRWSSPPASCAVTSAIFLIF
jgi:hypothetical protein